MNEESAGRVANVVIGLAAVGAALVVLKTPRLRKLAWRLAVTAVTVSGPAWFSREIQQRWDESARRRA